MSDRLDAKTFFNGYLGSTIIYALERTGAFDALVDAAPLDFALLAERCGLPPERLRPVLDVAVRLEFVSRDAGDRYALTETGRDVHRWLGYFTWIHGGYGELFRALPDWMRGADYDPSWRDGRQVVEGTARNAAVLMAEPFEAALSDIAFSSVADLGCGEAGRLIAMCRRDPGIRAVGVDRDGDAVAVARRRVAAAGLSERIEIVQGDCLNMPAEAAERVTDVDLVMSFMMMHDLAAALGGCGAVIPQLRAQFRGARTFLIADTPLYPPDADETRPIFNLAYDLAHAVMGVTLPPLADYEAAFSAPGVTVRSARPFGSPHTWLWELALS